MNKIIIKNTFNNELYSYECENNTIKLTVEKAVAEGVNLIRVDLIGADLRGANLSDADLIGADLIGADLSGANLIGADLRFNCCLFSAKTDKKYIQLSGIGSNNRSTTYCVEDDMIYCGCFNGTLANVEYTIEQTHKDSPLYLAEYRSAVRYIKEQKENYLRFRADETKNLQVDN